MREEDADGYKEKNTVNPDDSKNREKSWIQQKDWGKKQIIDENLLFDKINHLHRGIRMINYKRGYFTFNRVLRFDIALNWSWLNGGER